MNFLAPLFLLGGLAVTLPVLFHLMRRRSRERIAFSSLMFLAPTPPRVTRRSRLEHILLLVLRCTVLCLLALGFARPYFQGALSTVLPEPSGKRLVVLVDTSASMRRTPLWTEAKAKALAALDACGPLDQIGLYTFDRQLRSLITFEQWQAMAPAERTAMARQQLNDCSPGWSATQLGPALINAVTILEANLQRNTAQGPLGARQILVISDLQEGSRLDGLQGYDWPRGITISLEPLRAQRPSNAGLQWIAEDPAANLAVRETGPKLRISNAADSRKEQLHLRWLTSLASSISTGEILDVYVPAGQSRMASAPKILAGWSEGRLQLTGDDEDFDNMAYLVPPPTEKLNVVFLGAESETNAAELLYFLKRAFQDTPHQTIQILARPPGQTLLANEVAEASLVIIADRAPSDQLNALRPFMDAGKTVLLVMKSTGAAATVAGIMGSEAPNIQEAAATGYAMLGQLDFEHPLLSPFADPRFSDFTKIHFWRHRRLALDRLPQARIIGQFENGDPAMVQIPSGQGSLLVFTAGWHPADSQLSVSSKFVPLLHSLLEQSRTTQPLALQYWVGSEVNLTPADTTMPLKVIKPDGTSVELAPGNFKFNQTDSPGIYTVASTPTPRRFAVNVAPEESKTAPLSALDFERLGVPLHHAGAAADKQTDLARQRAQAAELENQQKLWQWLIFGSLAVLAMETGLAGWLTHRLNLQTEAST
jgi:hypothetical protein